ncbi:hypothetical protein [Paraburkholderia largidicola]|uniref:Uncharacterized protein n=1 Tax=Paraburkholderia largidicola TaxID=3014751 RepID=A0A7I8BJD5_9BURK|nr:hypothetical protein [Paraburkholderia sp. PGU16]BCF88722.1 hypothetical protein PPGU16_17890 [Paraburkholderia sp. PGU16]
MSTQQTTTTKVTMKMAKVSSNDIEQTLSLCGLLESISKGYYPSTADSEADEPTFFDEDDPEHLRVFYDRVKAYLDTAPGGVFRVAFGFSILMSNNVVDPDLDHLELHPRIKAALEKADATQLVYPADITPELHRVLSLMCFQLASFAHIFRAAGAEIKTRAEDEQAYCLHWLIKLVLTHGEGWAEQAELEIAAIRAKLKESK